MARNVTIPIPEDGNCVDYYTILYRIVGNVNWVTSPDNPYLTNSPVLRNLQDDTQYEVQIVRNCCGGLQSEPFTFEIDTTSITSPAS